MKVLYGYQGKRQYRFNVVTEAKRLTKEKGRKIKDIDHIELIYCPWGVSLGVFDKDNRLITNCAC